MIDATQIISTIVREEKKAEELSRLESALQNATSEYMTPEERGKLREAAKVIRTVYLDKKRYVEKLYKKIEDAVDKK